VTLNKNKKTESDEAETTCCGRLFHTRTAATGKARSPCKLMMIMTLVVVDYRVLQQFAQETVKGSSTPVQASIGNTTSDGNLVSMNNKYE